MKYTIKNSPQHLDLFESSPLHVLCKVTVHIANVPLSLKAMVIVDDKMVSAEDYNAADGEVFNLFVQEMYSDQLFFLQPQMVEDKIFPIGVDDLAIMLGMYEETKSVGFEMVMQYTDDNRPTVVVEDV